MNVLEFLIPQVTLNSRCLTAAILASNGVWRICNAPRSLHRSESIKIHIFFKINSLIIYYEYYNLAKYRRWWASETNNRPFVYRLFTFAVFENTGS